MKIKLIIISALFVILEISSSAALEKSSLPIITSINGVLRPRVLFVNDILGQSEAEFGEKAQNLQAQDLNNLKTNGFNCGVFETVCLESLASACSSNNNFPLGGRLHVISAQDPLSSPITYAQVDTGSIQAHWGLQSNKKNKKLTVMVASNSNGLETTSYKDVPTNITRYIYDNTQGPAASISAAPGTILRNYFAFQDKKPYETWRQNENQQINFLDEITKSIARDVGANIRMSNGYVILGNKDLEAIHEFFQKNKKLIKVGIHKDITVSHGLRSGTHHYFLVNSLERPIINQIFCAALDLGQASNPNNPTTQSIAKILLDAQVEATLKAAYLNNTDTLVLCMLGCGAFANDPAWLIESIKKSLEFIKKSGMNVVLNLFDGSKIIANKTLYRDLKNTVQSSGGSWLHYYETESGVLGIKDLCLEIH